MILFTILAFVAIALVIYAVAALFVGGAAVVVYFGDVIVCTLLIAFIVKCLIRKSWK